MNDIVVSVLGVTKLLKGLNPYKALGTDELHSRVVKKLASELGPVFAHLFQQSIDMDEIPMEWSLANICLLLKKGDRSLACNYRPASLTCVPCKSLENVVCFNIMAHLDGHKLLSDRQDVFRKRHSCETQLITVINDWAKIFDNGGQVDTFGSWARKWGTRFQPVKCNIMPITRKRIKKVNASYNLERTDLDNVEYITYLGVTITNELKWTTHVSNMCTKANRTLGFLRRNLSACPHPQDVKESAYKGLVRPVLEYIVQFGTP